MSFENLTVETQGPITRITLNRPKALNALNRATLMELERAVDEVPVDCRVLVITGSGEKAFVAGADISEMADMTPMQATAFSSLGHRVLSKLEAVRSPVIAEVNGFALGGGCELMLACDFAIASDNARLGQPEVGLGVTPGFGGSTRLTRRIGEGKARRMLYTGEQIKAPEALSLGLVSEVVPQAELRARVDEVAGQIAKNAPLAVAFAKRSALVGAETDLETANRYEQQVFGMCFATDDQKEGMKAFLEKRKADWKGH